MYVWSFALSRASASTGPVGVVARRARSGPSRAAPRRGGRRGRASRRSAASRCSGRRGSACARRVLGDEVGHDAVAERLDAGRASRAGSPCRGRARARSRRPGSSSSCASCRRPGRPRARASRRRRRRRARSRGGRRPRCRRRRSSPPACVRSRGVAATDALASPSARCSASAASAAAWNLPGLSPPSSAAISRAPMRAAVEERPAGDQLDDRAARGRDGAASVGVERGARDARRRRPRGRSERGRRMARRRRRRFRRARRAGHGRAAR